MKELNAFIMTNKELKETLENIGWKTFISDVDTGVSNLRYLPAYLPRYNPNYCSVKISFVASANKKLGFPKVLGEYLLRDTETQQLIAILQAEEIDDFSQCINFGEICQGMEKGIVEKEDLISLGEVLLGKAKGRTNDEDITFFKSTGVAFQDLITAIWMFEALEHAN